MNLTILHSLIMISIIGTIIFYSSSSYYYDVYAQQVSPDIVFKITNASAESSSDHKFILNITNLNTHKQVCVSGDCSIEIIIFNDNGLSTASVSLPTPGIQSMHSGVDFRLHDIAYNNMSEIKRGFQERWSIGGNCDIEDILDTTIICGKDTYDTITLSNEFQDIEISLPLVHGKYNPESDIIIFTANFNN